MSILCRACRYVMTRGCIAWLRRATATSARGGERGNHKGIRTVAGRKEGEHRECQYDDQLGGHASFLPADTRFQISVMLLDPTSREYKRARRHHYKTTKNRDGDTDTDWTPFRAAEKKYKARFPPPDLSDALDLALLNASRHADIERTGWKGRPDAVQVKKIDLDDARQIPVVAGTRKAFVVVDVPGG